MAAFDLLQQPGDPTGPPPSPDEVVRLLNGATTRELAEVHSRLGVFSRMLTWAYGGESGPLRVKSYDLELDGKPGLDCVVRVGDGTNTHNEMLLFLRRGDEWRCAGLIGVPNQAVLPPEPRSEVAPDGRAWLVIRAGAGSDGGSGYLLLNDSWFSVSEQEISLSLYTAVEGYHRGRRRTVSPPVDWELSSTNPRLTVGPEGLILQFTATIRMTATWPDGWKGIPATVPLEPAANLFTTGVGLRFRWEPSHREFRPDSDPSPWIGPDGLIDALLGTPTDFLRAAAADLTPIAQDPSPEQRQWLRLFLNACPPSPEADMLLRILGPDQPHPGPES